MSQREPDGFSSGGDGDPLVDDDRRDDDDGTAPEATGTNLPGPSRDAEQPADQQPTTGAESGPTDGDTPPASDASDASDDRGGPTGRPGGPADRQLDPGDTTGQPDDASPQGGPDGQQRDVASGPTGQRGDDVTPTDTADPTQADAQQQQFQDSYGLEVTGEGLNKQRAQRLQSRIISENDQITSPTQIRITREGDTFQAELTEGGAEQLAADQLEQQFPTAEFDVTDVEVGDDGRIRLQQSGVSERQQAAINQLNDTTVGNSRQSPTVAPGPTTTPSVPDFSGRTASAGDRTPRAPPQGGIVGDNPGDAISRRLESQLEAGTTADLERGEDFEIVGNLQRGFRARLTAQGQQTVGDAPESAGENTFGLTGSGGIDVGGFDLFDQAQQRDLNETDAINVTLPGVGETAINRIPSRVTVPFATDVGVDVPERVNDVPVAGTELEEFGTRAAAGTLQASQQLASDVGETTPEGAFTFGIPLSSLPSATGEVEDPEQQIAETTVRSAGTLASTPFSAVSATEEVAETGIGVAEGDVSAGEVATQGGVLAGQAVGTAVSRPKVTAGTLLLSAGLFSGTAAVSPRLGRATRVAVQPGEELASAGLTRAFPRVAQRFPNNRVDNEEIVLRGASRGARRAADTTRRLGARARRRTPDVDVEFDSNRPLVDLNGPDLSLPAVETSDVGVGSLPDVRGRAAREAQSAALEGQRLRRQAPDAVRQRARDLRDTPGELRDRAVESARTTGQRAALEAEAGVAAFRQRAAALRSAVSLRRNTDAETAALLGPVRGAFQSAILQPQATAAAVVDRARLPGLSRPSRPDVSGRVRGAGRQALFDLEVARAQVAEGGLPGVTRPSVRERLPSRPRPLSSLRTATTRGRLEVAAARAEVESGEVPSILPRPSTPSAPSVDVPPLGDLTIRIGGRRSGESPSRTLDVRGDQSGDRTGVDPAGETDRGTSADREVAGVESDSRSGSNQIRRLRGRSEREAETGVGREFDLEGSRRAAPAEVATLEDTFGASFGDARAAATSPSVRTDAGEDTTPASVSTPDTLLDLSPGLDIGERATPRGRTETEQDPGLETESAFEQEFGFESELALEQEQEQEQETELELEARRPRAEPFDLPELDADGDDDALPGLGLAETQVFDFGNPLSGGVLETTTGLSGDGGSSIPGFGDGGR
jgi:hypothetical protein